MYGFENLYVNFVSILFGRVLLLVVKVSTGRSRCIEVNLGFLRIGSKIVSAIWGVQYREVCLSFLTIVSWRSSTYISSAYQILVISLF